MTKNTPFVTAELINCLCSLQFETFCLADVLLSLAFPAVLSFQSAGLWKTKSTKVSGCLTPPHTTKLPSSPHSSWKKKLACGLTSRGAECYTIPPSLRDYTLQKMKWWAAQCHHSALLPPCGWIWEELSPALLLSHAKMSICVSISRSWGVFNHWPTNPKTGTLFC